MTCFSPPDILRLDPLVKGGEPLNAVRRLDSSETDETAPDRSDVAVVIPCYRVSSTILGVIEAIGPDVTRIYVVDDGCPEQSGRLVEDRCDDPRVRPRAATRHDDRRS